MRVTYLPATSGVARCGLALEGCPGSCTTKLRTATAPDGTLIEGLATAQACTVHHTAQGCGRPQSGQVT